MPAKSSKQFGLMQGVLHNSIMPGQAGPSRAVAKEFVHKTPASKRKKFAKELAKKKN